MENKEKQPNNSPWWMEGLKAFTKVSASIAIPIVIALYLGKFLDNKYNTAPWIFLGLTFIAFMVSLIFIWKNMMKYMKDIENENKPPHQDKEQ